MTPPIGLIAGQGRLPIITAKGIRATGRRVACVGLVGCYDDDLPDYCDDFATSSPLRINRWIKLLRRFDARKAVMIGHVAKTRMYDPRRLFRLTPDWRTTRLWYRVLRHDRRTASVLTAVADELSREGIELMDATQHIPEYLADDGCMTRCQPTREQLADIDFAWPMVRELNRLDIGQTLAAKDCEIIAVEAVEGTNAMIQRAGALCRMGAWTMIKTAKEHHDMRLDVPTIGPTTIEKLHESGGRCLVVEAGKVILVDKPRMLALADRLKVAVVGRSGS